jgi:DmsE family decaheme c-type cytochrome
MRRSAIAIVAVLVLLGFLPGMRMRAQQEKPPEAAPATPPATATAAEAAPAEDPPADEAAVMACADCHADQATAFRANPHGLGKAPKDAPMPNAVCESCHGDGTAHIEGGGDKTLIFTPRGQSGAEGCLTCHDLTTERVSRHAGVHANSASVNCLTCHAIHASERRAPHLLARPQLALCATCHATQAASFRNKPFAHHVGRGGTECSSCHEPHGRAGRDSLRTTVSGELPCLGCHFEKKGPFVFPHAAGVAGGDCLTCHEAHGSSNPKMLKRATVAQLCIECHSPLTTGTLGSQPPSFHNLRLPRYQNCTTCHVAVHGSNRDPQLLK